MSQQQATVYPSAPWEAPREPTQCTEFADPVDFLVKMGVHYDFQTQATAVVVMNLKEDNLLTEAIPLKGDTLGKVVRLLSELSPHYLGSIVKCLSTWRMSNAAEEMIPLDFTGKKKAAGKKPDRGGYGDRWLLVVDYIYTTALEPMIQHYDGTNIDGAVLDDLEEAILRCIMSSAIPQSGRSETQIQNQAYIRDKWVSMLRHISPYRMKPISEKLFRYIEENIKNQTVVMTALDGTRCVRLTTHSQFMEGNHAFLNHFHNNWKTWVVKNKSKEQRNAMCEYLGHVLKTATAATKEDQSDQWKKLVWAVHPNVDALLKKSKGAPFLFPVMTSILALHTHDFFTKNVEPLLEMVLAPQKETGARTLALESTYTLMNAACTKYNDGNQARLHKVISHTGKFMYPVGAKKVPFTPNLVQMEQMADIARAACLADAEFSFKNIVQPLLQCAIPEAHIVGLAAGTWAFLDCVGADVEPSSVFADPSLEYYNPFRKSSIAESRAKNLENSANDSMLSAACLSLVAKCQHSVLSGMHAQAGTPMMGAEGARPVQGPPLWALKAAVFSLHAVLPSGTGHMALLRNVASYTVHADEGLQQDALRVIRYIIQARPHYRADMAHAFAKFLPAIPASLGAVVNERLSFFVELLKLWRDEENGDEYPPLREYEPKPEAKVIDPNRMGGIALLYLCSPQPSRRELAYEIIELSRTIYERTSGTDVPPHDLFAIIAAYEEDIVGQSTYVRARMLRSPDVPDERKAKKHSLREMLERTSGEDQVMWSHALGGLVSYATGEEAELGKTIWESVEGHVMPALQLLERTQPSDPKFAKRVQAFTNYLTVAVAASDRGEPAELFRTVLPFVRGANEPLRRAAEIALSFVPQGSFGKLLSECTAIERQAFAEDKAGKLRARKCNLMAALAYVHRLIAENRRVGYIVHGTNAKPLFAHFGQQLDKFPGQVSIRADDDVLEWQFRRYNLSMFLYHVCADIAFAGKSISEFMTPALYNKALEFLSECSGCTHMVTGSSELESAQMKLDRGAYKPQVEAHSGSADEKATMMERFQANAEAVEFMGQRALATAFGSPHDPMTSRLVFVWFTNVFARHHAASARLVRPALLGVLRFNPTMLPSMVERAYGYENPSEAAAYAYTVAHAYNTGEVALQPAVSLTFALYMALSACEDVRGAATRMASLVFERDLNKTYDVATRSSCYDAQLEKIGAVYEQLAADFPDLVKPIILESFARLRMVDDPGRERLLRFVKPWMVHMALAPKSASLEEAVAFLEQLTLVTLDFDRLFFQHVQDMWMSLASTGDNAQRVVNFLVSQGVSKRNEKFLSVARKVSVLLARAQPAMTASALVAEFASREKVSFPEDSLPPPDEIALITAENAMRAMKDGWEKDAKYKFAREINAKPLSRADVALVMLLDVLEEHQDGILANAAVVLHACLMNLDDEHATVRQMSKRVMFSLVNVLQSGQADAKADLLEALHPEDDEKPLYCSADIRQSADSTLSRIVGFVAQLCSEDVCAGIADRAVRILSNDESEHQKVRSMQLLVALKRQPSHAILVPVFRVLTNNVGDYLNELALEALHTISTMVGYSSEADLLGFPQVLWLAVALLLSEIPDEYHIGAKLLLALVDKLNFGEEAAMNMVSNSFPKDWACEFSGLQTLVLKGLLSESTMANSVELLQNFTLLECDALVELGPTRLVDNLLGQLPWLVHQLGSQTAADRKAAMSIATVCNLLQQPDLGQVFRNYADDKFDDAAVFLDQFAKIFCAKNLAGHEIRALTFLWELRFEGPSVLHIPSMQVARAIMLHLDFSNTKLAQSILVLLFVLKQALEFDDYKYVAGVFDAVLAHAKEPIKFNEFYSVSELNKLSTKFEPRKGKTWESDDKGRARVLDALGKVMLSLGDAESGKIEDSRGDDDLFPAVEMGKVYSTAYSDVLLKEGGACNIAKMENPHRRILRVGDQKEVEERRHSRSMTLRMEQPPPSPRRATSTREPAAPSKLSSSASSDDFPPPPPPARAANDQMPPPPPARDAAGEQPPPPPPRNNFPPPPVEVAPPPPPR